MERLCLLIRPFLRLPNRLAYRCQVLLLIPQRECFPLLATFQLSDYPALGQIRDRVGVIGFKGQGEVMPPCYACKRQNSPECGHRPDCLVARILDNVLTNSVRVCDLCIHLKLNNCKIKERIKKKHFHVPSLAVHLKITKVIRTSKV